jgi:hypothetical protein
MSSSSGAMRHTTGAMARAHTAKVAQNPAQSSQHFFARQSSHVKGAQNRPTMRGGGVTAVAAALCVLWAAEAADELDDTLKLFDGAERGVRTKSVFMPPR